MENNSSGSCSSSGGGGGGDKQRTPLSRVVSDCVRRWFQETLKEAKAGDLSMQVLVGQMYFSGYGVPQDAHKVIATRGCQNLDSYSSSTGMGNRSMLSSMTCKTSPSESSWPEAYLPVRGLVLQVMEENVERLSIPTELESTGRVWMTRASRVRSSVWKVSNKRPGYNASDSDSDDSKGDS